MSKEQHCLSANNIRCPYCEYSHKIEAEDLPWTDEGESDKICYGCGKEFNIRANVSVSWITEQPEEEE